MQLFNVKRTKQNIQLHVLKIDFVGIGFKGYLENLSKIESFQIPLFFFNYNTSKQNKNHKILKKTLAQRNEKNITIQETKVN
jgi:hypothetical protein